MVEGNLLFLDEGWVDGYSADQFVLEFAFVPDSKVKVTAQFQRSGQRYVYLVSLVIHYWRVVLLLERCILIRPYLYIDLIGIGVNTHSNAIC